MLYDDMTGEFGFTEIDATLRIPEQQETVRSIIQKRIDLARFRQRVIK